MSTMNRIFDVYRSLGRVLNNPSEFGLGHRAPKPLIQELTKSRNALIDELRGQQQWAEEIDDNLEAELSQDADCQMMAK